MKFMYRTRTSFGPQMRGSSICLFIVAYRGGTLQEECWWCLTPSENEVRAMVHQHNGIWRPMHEASVLDSQWRMPC